MVQTVELSQAYKLMTRVDIDHSRRLLRVWFADGAVAVVPVSEIEKAGRPATLDLNTVKLSDPYVIMIKNVKGETEEIPWDFVRVYADEAFARSERDKGQFSLKALGERIRRLREQAGLSQEQLARKANIGRITLSRIENGKLYACTRTLEKIARALRVEVGDLVLAG
ncbi:MAG: helix-turn-helix transcriptional regulator [Candidatus Caldarchaeum sp.]